MDTVLLLLGFLQGLTEFLPISSSGHLFLMEYFLDKEELSLSVVLLLHLATFFSICTVFFPDIKKLTRDFFNNELRFFYKFCIALIPTLVIGLFFRSWVEQSFEKQTVGIGFLISGCFLASLFFIKTKEKSFKDMSFLDAFLIGSLQAVAVLPGFSRSALTITMAIYRGLSAKSAVLFSFLISLPVIAGSSLIDFLTGSLKDSANQTEHLIPFDLIELSLAFIIAFITGLISLTLVLKLVQSNKIPYFSLYLIPLSLYLLFIL